MLKYLGPSSPFGWALGTNIGPFKCLNTAKTNEIRWFSSFALFTKREP